MTVRPPPRISLIIPARNDAEALARTLDHLDTLADRHATEVIVATAGPLEDTRRAIAGRARALAPGGSTRAALMNAGAAVARGDILWFLHADSRPPGDALGLIAQALADARVVSGAFAHRFSEPGWSLAAINAINRIRYRLTRNYYGDQGIFVRAAVFRALGGYPDLALMEDLILSQRLKRWGKPALIAAPLYTSGRRFLARGPWRTFAFIVWLLFLHTLRLDTQRYANRWRGPADQPPGSSWPSSAPRGSRP
jgi:rSAM/selenodomain-associated transferase 2